MSKYLLLLISIAIVKSASITENNVQVIDTTTTTTTTTQSEPNAVEPENSTLVNYGLAPSSIFNLLSASILNNAIEMERIEKIAESMKSESTIMAMTESTTMTTNTTTESTNTTTESTPENTTITSLPQPPSSLPKPSWFFICTDILNSTDVCHSLINNSPVLGKFSMLITVVIVTAFLFAISACNFLLISLCSCIQPVRRFLLRGMMKDILRSHHFPNPEEKPIRL